MPQNALLNFYVELMTDPDKWAEFQNEPHKLAKEAGLSAEELELMMYGPKDKLKAYVEKGMGENPPCLVIGLIIW